MKLRDSLATDIKPGCAFMLNTFYFGFKTTWSRRMTKGGRNKMNGSFWALTGEVFGVK